MTTDIIRRQPARLPGEPWRALLAQAFLLIDDLGTRGLSDPSWTLGGGTVLMFRYRYRRSKDIDIFVPDPQCLGHMTPRLSDLAETITPECVEGAGYVKLLRPEGEIDFVASLVIEREPDALRQAHRFLTRHWHALIRMDV